MYPADRILQWNCRSLLNKKTELIYLINKHKPSILSISETWLRPDSVFRLSGFVSVRGDRQDGFGGVALFLKNNLPFSNIVIPDHSDSFEAVAVRIKDISVISLYIPRPTKSIIRDLISVLNSLSKPLLVLGDFNCHHLVWGCGFSDNVGEFLLDSLDILNLCILNDGSPTRRTRPNELTSAVDLSLCSPELASLMSWSVLPSTYGSDHFPILLYIPQKSPRPASINSPLLKYILDCNSLAWEKFNDLTKLKAPNLPHIHPHNIQSCSDSLVNILHECASLSFPFKKPRSDKIPSPPWWDKDCSNAIKSRVTAETAFCSSMTKENFIELNKVIAKTKRLLHSKKFQGWKSFCSSLCPKTPLSVIWRKINRYRLAGSPYACSFSPTQTWANAFMDKIAPQYAPLPSELPSHSCPISENSLDLPFTFLELKNVLKSVKDSAPGMDGIPFSFLSKASDALLNYYLLLVNCIFMSGYVPGSWKSQYIIPILKPHKEPDDPGSYRPIALSSVLTKIAEHLVKNRLEWFLESNGKLASSQYGFRKGKSTIDSLSIFITDIRLSFTRNESVIGAFLDVTGAYDHVQLPILRFKLLQLGVPPKLGNFVMNLLSERVIFLRCSDPSISCSRTIWRGLPQGSVLSPLLYNTYTFDLDRSVGVCRVLQYADDILLYSCHHSFSVSSNCLAQSLQSLNSWLLDNGLEISPSKSNIVLFSRKRKLPDVNISINKFLIPVRNSIKFLGLILDSKLNGFLHCDYISSKCEKSLNALRCLSGVWWGAHPFNLKLFYNAFIRSVLDYGSFLLEPCNKAGLKKLDLIQSKSLRVITGTMKSSPINALQVECVDPPFSLRRQFLANRFFFRSIMFSNHPLIPKLQLLLQYSFTSRYWKHKQHPLLLKSYSIFKSIKDRTFRSPILPIFNFGFDVVTLQPQIILNFDICKGDMFANKYFQEILQREWRDWHTIFTDASKLSPVGCVGYGVFHSQFDIVQKVKCPPESSVFTGECLAILEAVRYILLFNLHQSIIFSDSRSSLESLLCNPFSSKTHNPILFEIKKSVRDCLLKGLKVVFAWIPSHVGIFGNERVDRVAKEAVVCGDKVPFINYPHDLIALPKLYLHKSWSLAWRASSRYKGSSFAVIQPTIPSKPWFSRWLFSKRFTSTMTRLRLGHCCSPLHLKKIRIKDSSICECGLDEGDLNHIFFSCPLLNHSTLYTSLNSLDVSFPTHLYELLSSNNRFIYMALIDFLSSNNLKL